MSFFSLYSEIVV